MHILFIIISYFIDQVITNFYKCTELSVTIIYDLIFMFLNDSTGSVIHIICLYDS